jgi:tRNA threonylcarbamoyladenosine biosynthesis protein TsaB
MVELAIDTASRTASVAVMRDAEMLAERQWELETTFSQELLAAVDGILRSADVERTALTRIAVAVGPGGYTGLRTGVATAQGLAFALDLPLAGVARLEADALPLLDGDRPVVAVHDLGGTRGIAWAVYEAGATPVAVVEPRIDSAEGCAQAAPLGVTWTGEVTVELRAALVAAGREGDEFAAAVEPRAVTIIRLARLYDAYGDPADVDVLYLRPPSITRPGERSR